MPRLRASAISFRKPGTESRWTEIRAVSRTAGGIDTCPWQETGPSRPPTGKGSCLRGKPHETEHAQAAADGSKSRVDRLEQAFPKRQCNAGGKCPAGTTETCRTAGTPAASAQSMPVCHPEGGQNPPDPQMRNRHMHRQMPCTRTTDGRGVTGLWRTGKCGPHAYDLQAFGREYSFFGRRGLAT